MFENNHSTLAGGLVGFPAAMVACAGGICMRPPPGLEDLSPASMCGTPWQTRQPQWPSPATEAEQQRQPITLPPEWGSSRSRAEVAELLFQLAGGSTKTWQYAEVLSRQSTVDSTVSGGDSDELDASPSQQQSDEGPTTLMIRNIPAECTCEMLLQEWPIDGSYDLLYLPRRSGGQSALGYAFLNFTSPALAAAFTAAWKSKRLSHFPKGRGLNITPAEKQGFEPNVRRLQSKSTQEMRSRRCEIVVVREGRRIGLHEV